MNMAQPDVQPEKKLVENESPLVVMTLFSSTVSSQIGEEAWCLFPHGYVAEVKFFWWGFSQQLGDTKATRASCSGPFVR